MDETNTVLSPGSPQVQPASDTEGVYPPSASGGVLVERERGRRLSPLLLLLLALLLFLFFVLYFAGYTGREVRPQAVTSLPKPAATTPSKADQGGAIVVGEPEGEPSTVPGAPLGTPVLASDPVVGQPPQIVLTEAELAVRGEILMAFNRVNQEIFRLDYVVGFGDQDNSAGEAYDADRAVTYVRGVTPVGRFVEPYRLLTISSDKLAQAAAATRAGAGTATVKSILSDAQSSFDVAQSSLDTIISATY